MMTGVIGAYHIIHWVIRTCMVAFGKTGIAAGQANSSTFKTTTWVFFWFTCTCQLADMPVVTCTYDSCEIVSHSKRARPHNPHRKVGVACGVDAMLLVC
jgi:hypothetical protein